MNLSSLFHRPLLLAVPALALALGACDKKDKPAPTPAPETGRISVHHMAPSANVGLKFLFDDAEKATLTYGQSSLNQSVNVGSRTIKVNVASSNANVATQSVTVDKDKNYSFFAYSTSGTQLAGLLVPNDLATPSAGRAKIRLVHLGQGAASPLKLSTSAATAVDIPGTEALFANASPFVEILPGSYNVAVTSGSMSTTVYNVGEGTGSSNLPTGTIANKTYEAGKIYSVVFRGLTGPTVDPALQPKAVIVQHN
jgi:hypothetical protein